MKGSKWIGETNKFYTKDRIYRLHRNRQIVDDNGDIKRAASSSGFWQEQREINNHINRLFGE